MSLRTAMALAAAAFVAAPPAQAFDLFDQPVSVKVKASDLNLNTDEGAKVLLRRMNDAAEKICGPAPNSLELARSRVFHACVDQALTPTVASLRNPRVTALYARDHRAAPVLAANR